MWLPKSSSTNFYGGGGVGHQRKANAIVAVAIDKDKYSQHALKWAIEQLLTRDQTIVLIHVNNKAAATAGAAPDGNKLQNEKILKDLFLPFRCFCTRKHVQCIEVILEDNNIAKALAEYATQYAIEFLVLGAASRHGFIRFKTSDVPTHVMKAAPDFCTIYVISKGKISSAKKCLRPAPFVSPLFEQIQEQTHTNAINNTFAPVTPPSNNFQVKGMLFFIKYRTIEVHYGTDKILLDLMLNTRSPFTRPGRAPNGKLSMLGDLTESETDISFLSPGRASTDQMDNDMDLSPTANTTSRMSTSSDHILGPALTGTRGSVDLSSSSQMVSNQSHLMNFNKSNKHDNFNPCNVSPVLKLYSTASKESFTTKEKGGELQRWRTEEKQKMEEEMRKMTEKSRAATDKAEASRRIAEMESHKRVIAEMQALTTDGDDRKFNYQRYTIEEIEEATEYFTPTRKIGEGGYGPVFKGRLSNNLVAIKVLRPDAAQGRSQFQQEVEVLSCMRHPNMVLLLGACPEYGCLVYEYMANGCLEDRLLRRGNTPPLSWQIRFKIASEIATGILFLHQTKPEPIVHRDLKPGNILLDQNFVGKISDAGLARLLPPSIAEDITQYRMTSTAGTFCYIDPEYQQTGMLGVKSDVYSLGIMLLQMITARPAMGLSHHVENAIEKGTFGAMLDPFVSDWPQDEALGFAKLALQCAELRRKDRPDLGKEVLPELARLRDLGEKSMPPVTDTNDP
ncbi:U-box domain-containing protein 35-like [Bidens hawaiensis]|uniref:U-box domain-containing protein 35-like n=1 Tax=Bidens hawaiensis TaxID=980011 RepID=UPI00404B22CF